MCNIVVVRVNGALTDVTICYLQSSVISEISSSDSLSASSNKTIVDVCLTFWSVVFPNKCFLNSFRFVHIGLSFVFLDIVSLLSEKKNSWEFYFLMVNFNSRCVQWFRPVFLCLKCSVTIFGVKSVPQEEKGWEPLV